MQMRISSVSDESRMTKINPIPEDVQSALENLRLDHSIEVLLWSNDNYLGINYTDNADRVSIQFIATHAESRVIGDKSWTGAEYSNYYYLHHDGIRQEEVASIRTVPKEIAIPIALHFAATGELLDVAHPYYWLGGNSSTADEIPF